MKATAVDFVTQLDVALFTAEVTRSLPLGLAMIANQKSTWEDGL